MILDGKRKRKPKICDFISSYSKLDLTLHVLMFVFLFPQDEPRLCNNKGRVMIKYYAWYVIMLISIFHGITLQCLVFVYISWHFHGVHHNTVDFIGFSCSIHGVFMVSNITMGHKKWSFHGDFMDYSMILPWYYHDFFLV